ncbi:MAG: VanZ family protein [Halofilum sp. (in: g-proteobacteria)]|nr:VanZ family protein [Halofilum sp. (in: g-proteobacteria)]
MSSPRPWIAPALYMLLVVALSSIPGSGGNGTEPGPFAWVPSLISNALHLPLYAGLAFLWARALVTGAGLVPVRATIIALAIAAAFGVFDELYQGLVPGRSTSLQDWLANAVGAAAGCLVYLRFHRARGRRPTNGCG